MKSSKPFPRREDPRTRAKQLRNGQAHGGEFFDCYVLLAEVRLHVYVSTRELAEKFNRSHADITAAMQYLERRNLIKKVSRGSGGKFPRPAYWTATTHEH